MELVEGMEELLLHTLSCREELDIVDEEYICVSVLVVEVGDSAFIEGVYQIASEGLAGNVYDVEVGVIFPDIVGDSRDEVGLAHSRGAVNEQRIIVGNVLCSTVLCH